MKQKITIAAAAVVTLASLFIWQNNTGPQTLSSVSSMNSAWCRTFNGISSGISFANSNASLSAGNTMTVTAWVKWNNKSVAGSNASIVSLSRNTGTGEDGQFWLQHTSTNNAFEFEVHTLNGKKTVSGTTNPAANTWYHVAGVYDGANVKLYVNGVLQGSAAHTGNINNFQGNFELWLGRWASPLQNSRSFNGDIDEVTLWNTALTETELRGIMCKKLNGAEPNLLGYWRLDETIGVVISDKSSNGRNGIASNTVVALSGAPIGDASIFTYGGSQLTLAYPGQDSIMISNFSTLPAGVHIYRVDTIPNITTPPPGFTGLSNIRYYGVFIVDAAGATYTTTYFYNGHPGIADQSQLGLAERSSHSAPLWIDNTSMLNTASQTLVKSEAGGRHEYVLATKVPANILPIELLSFNAENIDGKIKLDWITATEKNNDFFTIERTIDGASYETVKQVKGAGNSISQREYTVTDLNPHIGTSYYRMKQTDYDGKFTYSQLVSVDVAEQEEQEKLLTIEKAGPNPFESSFKISFRMLSEIKASLALYNTSGQLLKNDEVQCTEGLNEYEYNEPSLKPGIYILKIIAGETSESVRLVKR